MPQIDPEKIDEAVRRERDRLAESLHSLADRIAAAPVERLRDGLTWSAPVAEVLVKTVDRALGRTK